MLFVEHLGRAVCERANKSTEREVPAVMRDLVAVMRAFAPREVETWQAAAVDIIVCI
jgi:inosine-uridine nucleoside N-ribohydrolase